MCVVEFRFLVYGFAFKTLYNYFFFFSSRRRHTRSDRDWSSDVCSSDLALKRDQVIIDVGYTVLAVPRNQIEKIIEGDNTGRAEKKAPTAAAAATRPDDKAALFQSAGASLPERSVRELVGQLGAAVVQVRTPGGLGSGFIISEAGYLLRDLHLI